MPNDPLMTIFGNELTITGKKRSCLCFNSLSQKALCAASQNLRQIIYAAL